MAGDDDRREQPRSELEARIVMLEGELTARDATIAELQAVIKQLAAQHEELTERLNRSSRNSHLPPSSDAPGAAARGKSRGKAAGKRKRGGQKGRRGAHRALMPEGQTDEIVDLYAECCAGCGCSLPQVPDVDARRYQLIELLVGKRHVKEFRRHEVTCPRCGHRTRAPYDPAKIPASPFGPQLVAKVAILSGVYHLSRRSVQQLLREFWGIDVSLGAISGMEARASAALEPAFEQAERAVQEAEIKHADGTSWLLAGVPKALWTVASTTVVVYKILSDGQRDTIRKLFGVLRGILVSDRAKVFGFWAMKLRQICWAHLLRKFISFSERAGPAGAIGRELLDYTALLFEYWHAFQAGELSRDELVQWMRPLQLQFEAALERAVAANIARQSGSCADILAHREALWTFVTHEGVQPTNNYAERVLRAFVLWRRRSFGCQSERGERFAERAMTVAQTLRQQGRDVLDFFVRSVTAHGNGERAPVLVGG